MNTPTRKRAAKTPLVNPMVIYRHSTLDKMNLVRTAEGLAIVMERTEWFFREQWQDIRLLIKTEPDGLENSNDLFNGKIPMRKLQYEKAVSAAEAADWFLRTAVPVEIRDCFELRRADGLSGTQGGSQ